MNTRMGWMVLAVVGLCVGGANAAIVDLAHYTLGEPGSLVSGRPQDSVGGLHFTAGPGGITAVGGVTPISNAYVTLDGNDMAYSADFSSIPTDNFAVEIWARTSMTTSGEIFELNGTNTASLKLGVVNGNWASSLHGRAWIGGSNGAGQAVQADTWTHLALIRDSGTLTLYINGVAQAGTTNVDPVMGSNGGHFGVESGGAKEFVGDLDDMRIFSFDAGDDPVAALSINNVPEPTTMGLLAAGGLCLLRRRKRRNQ